MEEIVQILVIFFFVLLNGFFVAAEFAIVKVRTSQIEQRATQGGMSAKVAHKILKNMDSYLSACQVGITFASLALGWIAEPFLAARIESLLYGIGIKSEALLHSITFGVAFGIITYLHIVVGEMAPKSISIRLAEKTALWTAIPLDLFYRLFRPFIAVLNQSALVLIKMIGVDAASESEVAHSEEELKLIFAHSEKSGHLTEREVEIMENVLALHDKSAKQIMIPRTSVVYLSTDKNFSENLNTTKDNQHTRYPLCDGDLDHVIGMIHIKDVLAATSSGEKGLRMAKLKRDVIFYPETITLDQLFLEFQRTKLHMAMLIDEYGGTTGIVTLEDVLEELVGEIYDEFDKPVLFIRQVGMLEYVVDGLCPVKLLEEKFAIKLPEYDVETIGGVVFSMAGHIPKAGYKLKFDGGSFVVEKIDKQRIAEVRLLLKSRNAPTTVLG